MSVGIAENGQQAHALDRLQRRRLRSVEAAETRFSAMHGLSNGAFFSCHSSFHRLNLRRAVSPAPTF
jgi:hypothetical protein